jgi:hypothetical protein
MSTGTARTPFEPIGSNLADADTRPTGFGACAKLSRRLENGET